VAPPPAPPAAPSAAPQPPSFVPTLSPGQKAQKSAVTATQFLALLLQPVSRLRNRC
jgi:hypothetical protein